MKKWKLYY